MRRVCDDVLREHSETGCAADRAERVQLYLEGLNRQVPSYLLNSYLDAIEKMKREADPEYPEYVRLRRKFENK